LIDELAGSCADAFPMLVKANGLAPLFGRRPIGLGGNVETFGPLSNSQASLALTRSLFTTHQEDQTYAPGDFIENNGVSPDIEHVITSPTTEANSSTTRNGSAKRSSHGSTPRMTRAGETRSPRRVSPNVEEVTNADMPIWPGSTRPSPAQRGRGNPARIKGMRY
jgi:C-terminal processing protease CtpA/Prc